MGGSWGRGTPLNLVRQNGGTSRGPLTFTGPYGEGPATPALKGVRFGTLASTCMNAAEKFHHARTRRGPAPRWVTLWRALSWRGGRAGEVGSATLPHQKHLRSAHPWAVRVVRVSVERRLPVHGGPVEHASRKACKGALRDAVSPALPGSFVRGTAQADSQR